MPEGHWVTAMFALLAKMSVRVIEHPIATPGVSRSLQPVKPSVDPWNLILTVKVTEQLNE